MQKIDWLLLIVQLCGRNVNNLHLATTKAAKRGERASRFSPTTLVPLRLSGLPGGVQGYSPPCSRLALR